MASPSPLPPLFLQPLLGPSCLLTPSLSASSLSMQSGLSSAFPAAYDDALSYGFRDFDDDAYRADAVDDCCDLLSNSRASSDGDVSSVWSTSEDCSAFSRQSVTSTVSEASVQSPTALFLHSMTGRVIDADGARTSTAVAALKGDLLHAASRDAAVGVAESQRDLATPTPLPTLPLPRTSAVFAFDYHAAEGELSLLRQEGEGALSGSSRALYESYMDAAHGSGRHLHNRARYSGGGLCSASVTATSAAFTRPSASGPITSLSSFLFSLSSSLPSHLSAALPLPCFTSHSPSSSSSSHPPTDPSKAVVGIYTRAERAAKIARYREKRANRQWKKRILYKCRKSFADHRPRVAGRFIRMKAVEANEAEGKGRD